jgi:hypothetical protein
MLVVLALAGVASAQPKRRAGIKVPRRAEGSLLKINFTIKNLLFYLLNHNNQ